MKTEKKQQNLSWPEKLAKRTNEALIALFDKLKFKKGEHWFKKFVKILIRVISVLTLIALSPLIAITIFLMIALAS
mgnify:CR=1 FL=1